MKEGLQASLLLAAFLFGGATLFAQTPRPSPTNGGATGGGATIPSTTSALKGDGAGNAAAVAGTGSNCVLVDGTSASCSGTAGASAALDNLSAVSINASLLPQANKDLGSAAAAWRSLFTNTIKDANGNPFLIVSATASAVDGITITNAATANPATVTVGATGSDSNINLSLVGKGTGGVQAPNGLCLGSSCPALTAGTGAVQGWAEGTVPTVCAASAVDCLYASLTQHGFLASFNNGSYLPLVQGPASQTTGRVASWNGTNGGLLADAGFLAANVVQAVAPGAGICHFAGSTQVCTSSAVSLTADVSGVLPTANIALALANQTSLHGITAPTAAGDATIAQVIAHGSTTVDFPSTGTGACASPITATATGTASTDVIIFNANASIMAVTGYVPASTGGISIEAYPTTNTVNFKCGNWTAGTVDPGSIVINWVVLR